MYVCMYVCMYVYVRVSMNVCMYVISTAGTSDQVFQQFT